MANKTIDMQFMRYINLFERIARVSTTDCFVYNNTIYFAVPKKMVMSAVGQNGANVKRISEVLRRRIRVIAMPRKEVFETAADNKEKENALREFVKDVVEPVEFTTFEFKDGSVFLSGARESKAILIGRDRSRERELTEVLQRTFGVKEFKII